MRQRDEKRDSLFRKCARAFSALPLSRKFLLLFLGASGLALVWFFAFAALFLPANPPYPSFLTGSLLFEDCYDAFMDFFNVNSFVAEMNPYYIEGDPGGGSSYPPLVLLFAKLFQLIGGAGEPLLVRSSARGILSCVLYYAIFFCAAGLCYAVFVKRTGLTARQGVGLWFALLFSAPMVYLIDRGNYLLYTIVFLAVFLLFERDERPLVRELAYLSLAAAIAFKLYPAIFALLLLREKRWGPFLRCTLYGAALVILPFACFRGGFRNIACFFENLQKFSAGPYVFEHEGAPCTNAFSHSLSAAMPLRVLYCLFSGTNYLELPRAVRVIGTVFTVLVALALAFTALFAKRRFVAVLSAASAIVLIPDPSYAYTSAVLILPLLCFLTEPKLGKGDLAYFVCFLCSFLLVELGYLLPRYTHGLQYGYAVINFVQVAACLIFCALGFGETIACRKEAAYGKEKD